jgi:hypothetical protein
MENIKRFGLKMHKCWRREAIAGGKLDIRADVTRHQDNIAKLLKDSTIPWIAVIGPLNVAGRVC